MLLASGAAASAVHDQPVGELILPLEALHNHGSSIVETPDGSLLAVWFRGSGERQADDVAIWAARRPAGTTGGGWSEPFVIADTPGFPDTNCTLLVDAEGALWLFWPTILDNRWESALMKVKVASAGDWEGAAQSGPQPRWRREFVLHMKPGDGFAAAVQRKTDEYLSSLGLDPEALPARLLEWRLRNLEMAGDKLTRRLGWFTRPHPIQLRDGRILVGLYSDGFSFSMTAFSDDGGLTWQMSEPIVGGGNVQPSLVELEGGDVLAFMRDNGPPPKLVQVARSADRGQTWSVVADHPDLIDSGAGVEALRLRSGRILVVHNDVPRGRHRLALSISEDAGQTFRTVRHLERHEDESDGRYSYPSALQARDGGVHVTYSVHLPPLEEGGPARKSIRHVRFTEQWLTGRPDARE